MAHVTRRPEAEEDILQIWEYIADDNISEADRWLDRLDEKLSLWATQPTLGRNRNDLLLPSIHSMPFGRYIVFYEPTADGLDVIRVLHASRDIDHFFGD
jgi:toxin ParE1/3/4